MGEFEQRDSEKETNDSHSTFEMQYAIKKN